MHSGSSKPVPANFQSAPSYRAALPAPRTIEPAFQSTPPVPEIAPKASSFADSPKTDESPRNPPSPPERTRFWESQAPRIPPEPEKNPPHARARRPPEGQGRTRTAALTVSPLHETPPDSIRTRKRWNETAATVAAAPAVDRFLPAPANRSRSKQAIAPDPRNESVAQHPPASKLRCSRP